MESISLTKRLLVAGGILICGYIAYSILKKREEELKQQEVTEEADYVIIIENDRFEDTEVEHQTDQQPIQKPKETSIKKVSTLSVVNDIEVEKSADIQTTDRSLTAHAPLISETDIIEVSEVETLEDPQLVQNSNDIQVTAPMEVVTEQKIATDDFPLQLGSKGKRVWNLKVYMLRNHGASGIVTDTYDTLTVERVKRYLKVDNVTEQLYKKLNMDNTRKKKKNAPKKKH